MSKHSQVSYTGKTASFPFALAFFTLSTAVSGTIIKNTIYTLSNCFPNTAKIPSLVCTDPISHGVLPFSSLLHVALTFSLLDKRTWREDSLQGRGLHIGRIQSTHQLTPRDCGRSLAHSLDQHIVSFCFQLEEPRSFVEMFSCDVDVVGGVSDSSFLPSCSFPSSVCSA